jgi:hypothetical protein
MDDRARRGADMGVLFKEGEEDYVLPEDQDSVWITVNHVSIYIIRRPNGVEVMAYPLGMELEDELDGFYVSWMRAGL